MFLDWTNPKFLIARFILLAIVAGLIGWRWGQHDYAKGHPHHSQGIMLYNGFAPIRPEDGFLSGYYTLPVTATSQVHPCAKLPKSTKKFKVKDLICE